MPPLTSSKVPAPVVDETLSSAVNKLFVANLLPGVRYQCFLQAKTRKGFGPPVMKEFWTEPSGKFIVCSNRFVPKFVFWLLFIYAFFSSLRADSHLTVIFTLYDNTVVSIHCSLRCQ